MQARTPLCLALAAGMPLCAAGQEAFLVHYSWIEVHPGTITPVAVPNSVLEPGEAARVRIGVSAQINGVNAVGQTTAFAQAPNGIGTVRGLSHVVYDLLGDNNATSANGTWGGFAGGLSGVISGAPFAAPIAPPTPEPGGSSFIGIGGAQFVFPPLSANPHNSNVQILRGVWLPASYSPRTVNFIARASIVVPSGEHNGVLVAYGVGTDPGTGANFEFMASKNFATNFGSGTNIPIAPAPPGLALVALGALAPRRQRPGDSA